MTKANALKLAFRFAMILPYRQVLKRLSNPLSWMDSFNSESGSGGGSGNFAMAGGGGGSGTPPILMPSSGNVPMPHQPQHFHQHDLNDPNKPGGGVLSSMFTMTSNVTSNVSNMLTR